MRWYFSRMASSFPFDGRTSSKVGTMPGPPTAINSARPGTCSRGNVQIKIFISARNSECTEKCNRIKQSNNYFNQFMDIIMLHLFNNNVSFDHFTSKFQIDSIINPSKSTYSSSHFLFLFVVHLPRLALCFF
eukprot:GHVT01017872.1.p1 GENE.GHVT01017872.1~~GHVT01017872.1.p1  ORF type:complete len:132 (+),score=6.91 GHVT01017872.1:611-1006(+)